MKCWYIFYYIRIFQVGPEWILSDLQVLIPGDMSSQCLHFMIYYTSQGNISSVMCQVPGIRYQVQMCLLRENGLRHSLYDFHISSLPPSSIEIKTFLICFFLLKILDLPSPPLKTRLQHSLYDLNKIAYSAKDPCPQWCFLYLRKTHKCCLCIQKLEV